MKRLAKLFRSRGGIHPPTRKDATAGEPIVVMPLPALLTVPLAQHLGAPAKAAVKKGDAVRKGQVLGEAAGFISASVHAPTSGVVKAVSDPVGPAGRAVTCVEIEPDGQDAGEGLPPWPDWPKRTPKDLIERVAACGLVGMGGAGFPTHVKLSPPPGKVIDTLVLNGAECEPCLTADARLMIERPDRVAGGLAMLRHIVGARRAIVAVEDNKPEAIRSLEKALAALDGDVSLAVLRTEYPQGAEKQQIFAVTGREVPSGGLPMDVGALVENVGTAAALYEAVVEGKPLIERVITVTGRPLASPRNVQARVGTSLADLVAFCGGLAGPVGKAILGGPMMGVALESLAWPVTKTSSGLVFLAPSEIAVFTSMACIGCGRCVAACPMGLLPCTLSEMAEAGQVEAAGEANVLDCIECGCCAYVCPAHRPLVQHLRQSKLAVGAFRREREARERAARESAPQAAAAPAGKESA
jgi:electron transport complex protein RnfC